MDPGFAISLEAQDSEDTQARYKLIFSVSITIFCVYVMLTSAMLLAIRCNIQPSPAFVLFTFLLSFTSKAISDTLRIKKDKISSYEEIAPVISLVITAFDKTREIIIIIYSFIIKEVRIKLESQSFQEFSKKIKTHRKYSIIYPFVFFCKPHYLDSRYLDLLTYWTIHS